MNSNLKMLKFLAFFLAFNGLFEVAAFFWVRFGFGDLLLLQPFQVFSFSSYVDIIPPWKQRLYEFEFENV